MGGYGMIEYRIRRGDTLPKLSAKFGVPVCMIVRANEKVFHEKAFRIGSTVKIPEIDFCSRTDKNGCFAKWSAKNLTKTTVQTIGAQGFWTC